MFGRGKDFPLLVEANQEKSVKHFHFLKHLEIAKIRIVMGNNGLLKVSFLARDLQYYSIVMKVLIGKNIYIFLICLSLVFISFLCPFSTLQEDYISAAPLIGQEKGITLTEPAMMLFVGSGLLGIGIYTRRKYGKRY
jgi:hypothetical protein